MGIELLDSDARKQRALFFGGPDRTLFQRGDQGRQQVLPVSYSADVRCLENAGVGVLVDGNDLGVRVNASQVLRGS